MHQIIIQHFSANPKRVFREIIISSRNSFSYCFYRSINIIHYRFSAGSTPASREEPVKCRQWRPCGRRSAGIGAPDARTRMSAKRPGDLIVRG
jgi:hypothetical protein